VALVVVIEELNDEIGDKVEIYHVDVDHTSLANRFNVTSIPCVLAFKDGEVIGTLVGVVSIEKYYEMVGMKNEK
jgi:thioredoxin 1